MKAITLIIFSVLSLSAHAQYFPYIQTHKFELEPYVPRSHGYAAFIASSAFDGSEKVDFISMNGTLFPDIPSAKRTLTAFSSGNWYMVDQERITSATSGSLPDGKYRFEISRKDRPSIQIELNHTNFFLRAADSFQVFDHGELVEAHWQADPQANSFWVFVFPTDTKDILRDLIPVSSVLHLKTSLQMPKAHLPPGEYKFAVRSNRLWEGGTNWGIDAESWGASQTGFRVQSQTHK